MLQKSLAEKIEWVFNFLGKQKTPSRNAETSSGQASDDRKEVTHIASVVFPPSPKIPN